MKIDMLQERVLTVTWKWRFITQDANNNPG